MRRNRLRYLLPQGFFTLAWTEWGPETGAPVLCVHGLTRNGRDFDALAAALAAEGRRVLCPDLPGRGESDWLPDPALYLPPTYRSEERRVGKECRSRGSPYHSKKKEQ